MIKAEVESTLNERRDNRARVRKLLERYDEEFEKFNYTQPWAHLRCDGSPSNGSTEHCHAARVRSAILSLLRAHFRVENINRLSADMDDEAMEIVETILRVVKPKEA